MSLHSHTSNRVEELAAILGEILRQSPLSDPLAPETIVVQSRGMARWLSLQLSGLMGVAFHLEFLFPREAVAKLLRGPDNWTLPSLFTIEKMTWGLYSLLPTLAMGDGFERIRQYLDGGDSRKRYQLARQLAGVYDQYLLYRPDLLLEWENNPAISDWDAAAWRALVEEGKEKDHLVNRFHAFSKEGWPASATGACFSRLSIFGISSLPPVFLEVMARAGRQSEVHLFLLQPSPGYWGDLVTLKRKAKARPGEAVWLDSGHPLVPSLGRQGQDLLNLMIDVGFDTGGGEERFIPPEGNSLLHQLQRDMLELVDRRPGGEYPPFHVGKEDDSIQIHSCHSPLREIEVLHDQLLHLLAKVPGLRPRDILVMAPDIETHAPYIEAVFGHPEPGLPYIPHSVVDRRSRMESPMVDAWFGFLDLARSRFNAKEVTALVETIPIRSKFGLSEADCAVFRKWIAETGIRWGVDSAHRSESIASMRMPETTWNHGVKQWLLGLAMHDRGWSTPGGCFPYPEMEGSHVALLEKILPLLEFLFLSRSALGHSRGPADWARLLQEQLDFLFDGLEDYSSDAEAVRSCIHQLNTAEELLESGDLPLEVVRTFLEEAMDARAAAGGRFLSGGVTFCTLQPMRTIPAKVIWLLGMDDTSYPRRPAIPGFNRMRNAPRCGDRSPREDDRYLFLETILSARGVLGISHVGQSMQDLSRIPPSVLVRELMDHLNRGFVFPPDAGGPCHRHRLQPFHPVYFSGGRLFSFSKENEEACRRLTESAKPPSPFFTTPLPPPEESFRTVSPAELIRFFGNPAGYFLRRRLGLELPREDAMPVDAEPFSLEPLERHQLKEACFRALAHKEDPALVLERFRCHGRLPLGTTGRALAGDVIRHIRQFHQSLEPWRKDAEGRFENTSLTIGSFVLRGPIGPFYANTLLHARPGAIRGKDLMVGWVQHLVALASGMELERTILAGEETTLAFPPRADSLHLLSGLLERYWQGLREPLRFFPETSRAYFEQTGNPKAKKTPMEAARQRFEGGLFQGGGGAESTLPEIRLCWANHPLEDILNPEFEVISMEILGSINQVHLPK